MDEGQERVQATYRDNYARLAKVKNRYDPANLFGVNRTSNQPDIDRLMQMQPNHAPPMVLVCPLLRLGAPA
jgi:hypothetical protein